MEPMTADTRYVPPLERPQERTALGQELAAVLHDLVALALTGKQLHWTVVGPLSHVLHLQLDGLVEGWRALADVVAERAVALGHVVDGQAAAVAAASELTSVTAASIEDRVALHEMTHRVAAVSERARGRLRTVGELDPVSQDVVIGVVRALEKDQWMLRMQIARAAAMP